LFPNPATDIINISMNGYYFRDVQVNVYNILGKQIDFYNYNDFTDRLVLDISGLSAGIYLFTISTEQGMISEKVSIINQ